jgi:glycosyltransferase involved in cell wall biosynthesis
MPVEELPASVPRPLKVLVSAFAFSPVKGSEFGVGWDYVRAVALKHKVWVITRSIEREETEEYMRHHAGELRNVSVHYVPLKNRTINIPFREIVYGLIYRNWQQRAYRLARALDAEVDFDLIHHLNGIGFREPGYLWKLGKPFVWGPVGGMQYFPWWLRKAVPFRSRLFFLFKNLANAWAMHADRRPRLAAAGSNCILAATSNVAEKIREVWGRDSTLLCEVSAPHLEPRMPARREPGQPLRIIWCGACDPAKTLNIVLHALRLVSDEYREWQLIAIGDGRLRKSWMELAERLGIADRCTFTGRVPRTEVHAMMTDGHCLVQPSLYDATSTVVVEALSYGLPVVCLDHFGFSDAVSADCGIKIPPNNLDQVIHDFAHALLALARDENRRYAMATASQMAALEMTFRNKEAVLEGVYRQAMAARSKDGEQSWDGRRSPYSSVEKLPDACDPPEVAITK